MTDRISELVRPCWFCSEPLPDPRPRVRSSKYHPWCLKAKRAKERREQRAARKGRQ